MELSADPACNTTKLACTRVDVYGILNKVDSSVGRLVGQVGLSTSPQRQLASSTPLCTSLSVGWLVLAVSHAPLARDEVTLAPLQVPPPWSQHCSSKACTATAIAERPRPLVSPSISDAASTLG
ncbi:hypothetical protein F443_21512 [Phytophthora nicotianae P1569]|uniref:Uncharacterized protein n=2 Tax=Phytophthora nicotianae TaxID=4792 RepID=V9DYZ1_PHYNI|nr:hypothetical protein F443_21512 [Phytophthora nicotianae P1569]ETO60237.1 hypothetical protein F444_21522 [Phytophthora nicotianae P1976]